MARTRAASRESRRRRGCRRPCSGRSRPGTGRGRRPTRSRPTSSAARSPARSCSCTTACRRTSGASARALWRLWGRSCPRCGATATSSSPSRSCSRRSVLELFPDTAEVADDGGLVVGGLRAEELAAEFGTPLVVYCRETLLAQARAYRAIEPDALVAYGVKAFPNVALLRLFAEEGLGADVSR